MHYNLVNHFNLSFNKINIIIYKSIFACMEIEDPKLLQPKNRKRSLNKRSKSFFLVSLFVAFIIYRFTFPEPSVECINDAYHNFTLQPNRKIVESSGPGFQGNSNQLTVFGKAFLGIGQVLMDIWIAILGFNWLFTTKNLRAMLAVALFYIIRGTIFLNVEKFPYPDNLAWRNPGFFSVTVPYDHTRDFFFSGHCGGLTIVTSEMFQLGYMKTGVFGIISLLYMANMLLTTEVHYTIDILAGILYSLWFYQLAKRLAKSFDKLVSLPYVGWTKLIQCLNSEQLDDQSATSSQNGDIVVQSNQKMQKPTSQPQMKVEDALNEEIQ